MRPFCWLIGHVWQDEGQPEERDSTQPFVECEYVQPQVCRFCSHRREQWLGYGKLVRENDAS